MEHPLTESALTLLGLEALTQLIAVDGQVSSQRADGDVWVVHEVILGLEIGLATMNGRF